MTAPWNGHPPAPLDEVDGWHWLRASCGSVPCEWNAEFSHWRVWSERNPPALVVGCGWQYVAPCLTPDQIAAQIAEAVKAERGALHIAEAALASVVDGRMSQYQARNGRWVTIEADDGERCDIIHSDITNECEGALDRVRSAIRARGETA